MAKNQGKKFEQAVKESFDKVEDISVDRIPDQVTKYKGSTNICDFTVYKFPLMFYLECKSVHGNTISIYSEPKLGKDGKLYGFYGNIRDNQWDGLLEKSKIFGVRAGVIIWWIDKDVTKYYPIEVLEKLRNEVGLKSVRYDYNDVRAITLTGEKKRVYYDYDMGRFLRLF